MKVEGESEILASLVAVKLYLITEQFRGTNLGSKFGEKIGGASLGSKIWGANLGGKFGEQI